MSPEFRVPELSVVFLIPFSLTGVARRGHRLDRILTCDARDSLGESYYIPREVSEPDRLPSYLRLFYDSDIEYFDPAYLDLKRFCRIGLEEYDVSFVRDTGDIRAHARPFLTLFDVGIGVYTLWLSGLTDVSKRDIIDMCFLSKIHVRPDHAGKMTLLEFVKARVEALLSRLDWEAELDDAFLIEHHLVMLFVKDFPFGSPTSQVDVSAGSGVQTGESIPDTHTPVRLPADFIEQYRNHIFDIVSLPDRYYGKVYDYHKSRTPEYLERVLRNISVRNDFPVFVFRNRFLGIKICTGEPDYGFDKRIVFNVVLYTNVVLQLVLIKDINNNLLNLVKNLDKATLSHIVDLRRALYQDLEEYINTSIQRIEVWRIAMEDAARQLSVPEFYNAARERLEMLDSYLLTAFQRHSNVLFLVLNAISFVTAVLTSIDIILGRALEPVHIYTIIVLSVLWTAWTLMYHSRYVR